MKTRFIRLSLLAIVIAMALGTVQAQAPASRKKTKRSTTKKKTNTSKNSNANTAVVPPKDTTAKPVQEFIADIKLDTPRKSLRNDASV
ncbi:MAG: hypothetical protein M3N30_07650, partial [Bacteroidota bacterium]|nr:hypothetical protein [Bacteroidota bacterium]